MYLFRWRKGGGVLMHVYVWEHIVSLFYMYRTTWWILIKLGMEEELKVPYLRLRHFRLPLQNSWTEFNKTWQEARSKFFFGPISQQKWLPWPIRHKGGTLYSGVRYVALFLPSIVLFFFFFDSKYERATNVKSVIFLVGKDIIFRVRLVLYIWRHYMGKLHQNPYEIDNVL